MLGKWKAAKVHTKGLCFWDRPDWDYSWWLSGKGRVWWQVTLRSEGPRGPTGSALPRIPTGRQAHLWIGCFYLDKAKKALVFTDPEPRKSSVAEFLLHAVAVVFLELSPPLRSPAPPWAVTSCNCRSFNIWNKGDSSSSLRHSPSGKQGGKKKNETFNTSRVALRKPRPYKPLPGMSGMERRVSCAVSFTGRLSTWKEKLKSHVMEKENVH